MSSLLRNEVGLESFYNFAITPWLQLSGDAQWLSSAKRSSDNAWVLGTVKARYVDPPIFLDVQQIVTQYTFEASGTINAPHWDGVSGESSASATGRWSESPTITFNPMTGETYIKSLIRPVDPADLMGLVEAGWPIDAVFSIGVRSINGLHASTHAMIRRETGNLDYYRVLTLLRQLQDSGAVALRIEDTPSEQKAEADSSDQEKEGTEPKSKAPSGHTILIMRSRPADEPGQRASQEVRQLLHLSPDADEAHPTFIGSNVRPRSASFCMVGMLMRPPKGDQAA